MRPENRRLAVVAGAVLAMSIAAASAAAQPPATQPASAPDGWPGFRGPDPGHASPNSGDPPTAIDPNKDVLWKVRVPAAGQSSPIVSGGRVYLTGEGHRVMAFEQATGKLLWNTRLDAPEPLELPGDKDFEVKAEDTGAAAPTPATDGQRVYAFFGSSVLGCVDRDGKEVWSQRLVVGKPRNTFGLASSPVLHGELVIVQVDMGKEPEDNLSFIAAVRARNGTEVWRTDRPVASSWTTPVIAKLPEGETLFTTAAPLAIGYDPTTGAERWRAEEVTGDAAACPLVCGGLLLAYSGEGGQIMAIKPGGKGDVSKTHVAWTANPPLPDVASPVCDGKRVYHLTAAGDLAVLDAATGKEAGTVELRGRFWASPVLVGDRIYAVNSDGVLYVVSTSQLKVLAKCELGQKVTATPAIVAGRIYIRTEKDLLCIGK